MIHIWVITYAVGHICCIVGHIVQKNAQIWPTAVLAILSDMVGKLEKVAPICELLFWGRSGNMDNHGSEPLLPNRWIVYKWPFYVDLRWYQTNPPDMIRLCCRTFPAMVNTPCGKAKISIFGYDDFFSPKIWINGHQRWIVITRCDYQFIYICTMYIYTFLWIWCIYIYI